MAATGNLKTAAELDDALRLLDHEVQGLNMDKPLRVRAIGGYALMKHGVRKGARAYTVDIDTVTKRYSAEVERAIQVVADKLGLDKDWLNNDNVMDDDPEQVEDMLEARWLPQPLGLRNVHVEIATIDTLTRAKIIAAEDAEFSGRDRDLPDLLDLLEHQKITSTQAFRAKYPDTYGEYGVVASQVQDHFARERARKTAASEVGRRFPELSDTGVDATEPEIEHDIEH